MDAELRRLERKRLAGDNSVYEKLYQRYRQKGDTQQAARLLSTMNAIQYLERRRTLESQIQELTTQRDEASRQCRKYNGNDTDAQGCLFAPITVPLAVYVVYDVFSSFPEPQNNLERFALYGWGAVGVAIISMFVHSMYKMVKWSRWSEQYLEAENNRYELTQKLESLR